VGFYRRDETIDHRVYPKPDSRYGVSKVFGEALGSLYADKYGMEVFNIRIGNVNPRRSTSGACRSGSRRATWRSWSSIGIDHPDIRFEIVYGVSDNARSWYDNSNAHALGYKPQDESEPLRRGDPREGEARRPRIERYQGGTFVLAELGGDPFKPPPTG
jgi:uronate dehydrogenase